MMKRRHGLFLTLAVLLAATTVWAGEQPVKVGLVVGLRGKASAQLPGQTRRTLALKGEVYKGDVIKTKSKGKLQIMFDDNTTITVGPRAKLTIDEFVYKPGDKNSKCEVSLSQGVFKALGGAISKVAPDNVKVKTPPATIGIRGTLGMGHVLPDLTRVVFVAGTAVSVTNDKGQEVLESEPGLGNRTRLGEAPGRPYIFSPQELFALSVTVDLSSEFIGRGIQLPPVAGEEGEGELPPPAAMPKGRRQARRPAGDQGDQDEGDLTQESEEQKAEVNQLVVDDEQKPNDEPEGSGAARTTRIIEVDGQLKAVPWPPTLTDIYTDPPDYNPDPLPATTSDGGGGDGGGGDDGGGTTPTLVGTETQFGVAPLAYNGHGATIGGFEDSDTARAATPYTRKWTGMADISSTESTNVAGTTTDVAVTRIGTVQTVDVYDDGSRTVTASEYKAQVQINLDRTQFNNDAGTASETTVLAMPLTNYDPSAAAYSGSYAVGDTAVDIAFDGATVPGHLDYWYDNRGELILYNVERDSAMGAFTAGGVTYSDYEYGLLGWTGTLSAGTDLPSSGLYIYGDTAAGAQQLSSYQMVEHWFENDKVDLADEGLKATVNFGNRKLIGFAYDEEMVANQAPQVFFGTLDANGGFAGRTVSRFTTEDGSLASRYSSNQLWGNFYGTDAQGMAFDTYGMGRLPGTTTEFDWKFAGGAYQRTDQGAAPAGATGSRSLSGYLVGWDIDVRNGATPGQSRLTYNSKADGANAGLQLDVNLDTGRVSGWAKTPNMANVGTGQTGLDVTIGSASSDDYSAVLSPGFWVATAPSATWTADPFGANQAANQDGTLPNYWVPDTGSFWSTSSDTPPVLYGVWAGGYIDSAAGNVERAFLDLHSHWVAGVRNSTVPTGVKATYTGMARGSYHNLSGTIDSLSGTSSLEISFQSSTVVGSINLTGTLGSHALAVEGTVSNNQWQGTVTSWTHGGSANPPTASAFNGMCYGSDVDGGGGASLADVPEAIGGNYVATYTGWGAISGIYTGTSPAVIADAGPQPFTTTELLSFSAPFDSSGTTWGGFDDRDAGRTSTPYTKKWSGAADLSSTSTVDVAGTPTAVTNTHIGRYQKVQDDGYGNKTILGETYTFKADVNLVREQYNLDAGTGTETLQVAMDMPNYAPGSYTGNYVSEAASGQDVLIDGQSVPVHTRLHYDNNGEFLYYQLYRDSATDGAFSTSSASYTDHSYGLAGYTGTLAPAGSWPSTGVYTYGDTAAGQTSHSAALRTDLFTDSMAVRAWGEGTQATVDFGNKRIIGSIWSANGKQPTIDFFGTVNTDGSVSGRTLNTYEVNTGDGTLYTQYGSVGAWNMNGHLYGASAQGLGWTASGQAVANAGSTGGALTYSTVGGGYKRTDITPGTSATGTETWSGFFVGLDQDVSNNATKDPTKVAFSQDVDGTSGVQLTVDHDTGRLSGTFKGASTKDTGAPQTQIDLGVGCPTTDEGSAVVGSDTGVAVVAVIKSNLLTDFRTDPFGSPTSHPISPLAPGYLKTAPTSEQNPDTAAYVTWGRWGTGYVDTVTGRDHAFLQDYSYWVAGSRTTWSGSNPYVKATYEGTARASWLPVDATQPVALSGTSNMAVDFYHQSVEGTINLSGGGSTHELACRATGMTNGAWSGGQVNGWRVNGGSSDMNLNYSTFNGASYGPWVDGGGGGLVQDVPAAVAGGYSAHHNSKGQITGIFDGKAVSAETPPSSPPHYY